MIPPDRGSASATARDAGAATIRVDKWLWFARFFKSRSLAAKAVGEGLRINGQRVTKSSATVKVDDVLTFARGPHVRVIRVVAPGMRRGPAPEAQTLYEDLSPPAPRARPEPAERPDALREPGAGRPTKRERRRIDAFREQNDEPT